LVAVAAGACAGAPPAIDAVASSAAATAVPDAIQWRDAAEPLDAEALSPDELAVADAVRAALQHDARLQEALAGARGALAAANAARRWPNPLLDVAVRLPSGGGAARFDLGLTADVVAVLQTPARARAADARLALACAAAVAAAIDAVAAVQVSYYRVQALDAEAPLLAARRQAAEQLAALAHARLANGDAAPIEVAEFDALALQVRIDAADRARERAAEGLLLCRLLGEPGRGAPPPLRPWQLPPPGLADEGACVRMALQRRPELAAAAAEVSALGEDLGQAGLAWLAGARLGAAAQREDLWSVGPSVALPLPLFDSGAAKADAVSAELAAACHRATARGREVVEGVRAAVRAVAAADERLRAADGELLPQQRRRRELAELAWRNGDGDRATLLRAEQELRATEAMLVLAQRDAWLSRVLLERAVGGAAAWQEVQR
jgi:outer membrane protein TolC